MFSSRARSRLAASLTLALSLGVAVAAGAQPAASFLAFDGHSWRGLSEAEKLALLTGFLIGAALERGLAGDQSLPSPETLEAMRREGRARFPFAPTVYKARLEDFYFYQDRLGVPLYRALVLINEQIRQGAPAPR